jgi:hypothetical protein
VIARGLMLGALLASVSAHAWTLRATNLGGWVPTTLTVYYNFTDCTRPEADLIDILDDSIDLWNNSENSGIRLVRATTASTGTAVEIKAGTASPTPLIACDTAFTANQGVDGNAIPALTLLAALDSHIAYGGIVLNAETGKTADIGQLSRTTVYVAIAHEMGHILGLGHTSDTGALMYYNISGKTSAALARDDMDGIAYLYPRNEFNGGPYGCARANRPARAGGFWWLLLLVGVNVGVGRVYCRVRPERLL